MECIDGLRVASRAIIFAVDHAVMDRCFESRCRVIPGDQQIAFGVAAARRDELGVAVEKRPGDFRSASGDFESEGDFEILKAVEVRPSTQPRCGLAACVVSGSLTAIRAPSSMGSGRHPPGSPCSAPVAGSPTSAARLSRVRAVGDVDTGGQAELAAAGAAQFLWWAVSVLARACARSRGRGHGRVVR